MSRKEILENSVFTNHFIERCKERNIDHTDINYAVLFGNMRFTTNNCCKFMSNKVCIVMNMSDNTYVTAWRR